MKEFAFGMVVARGDSDPSVQNEEADPTRPPEAAGPGDRFQLSMKGCGSDLGRSDSI